MRRLFGAGLVTALVGSVGFIAAATPAAAAPESQTFTFTGVPQTFTVPANVCQITVDTFGAQGGNGGAPPGVGGLGGRARPQCSRSHRARPFT